MTSLVTTRQKPPMEPTTCKVEFQSILRIRPLKKAEKEDHIVLEPSKFNSGSGAVALLHPIIHMTSPDGKGRRRSFEREMGSPMFIKEGEEQQFHFDSILDSNATQDKVHYSMGLNFALDAMEPLKHVGRSLSSSNIQNHLVVSMGVANTGKTYTSFGSQKATARTSGKHSEDGLVPRILESFFSQSQHHIRDSNLSFAVRITMLHAQGDKVYDMLSVASEPQLSSSTTKRTPKKSGVRAMVASFERGGNQAGGIEESAKTSRKGMEELKIEQDSETHDFIIDATARNCRDGVEAREAIQSGLKRVNASGLIGGLVGKSNRGHTLISITPVLLSRRSGIVEHAGGTITVLDMAGIERVKKGRGAAMRDSIAINSSLSAVMHCLRTIQHNNDIMSGESTLDVVCEDDESLEGSDISNVSEEKGAKMSRNFKKVPYLQSKLTMLLQPCFSATSSKTLVTILLAAYPGHRDYSEKKALLADLELLRGVRVASRTGNMREMNIKRGRKSSTESLTRANTGMDSQLELSDIDDSGDEIDNTDVGKLPCENRNAKRLTPYKLSSKSKKPSHLDRIKELPPALPSTPSAPTESMLGVDDITLPPPAAFAPASQVPRSAQNSDAHHSRSCANESPSGNDAGDTSALRLPNVNKPRQMKHSCPHSTGKVPNSSPTLPKSANVQAGAQLSDGKQQLSTARATVAASPNIRPPLQSKQSPIDKRNVLTSQSPNTQWAKDSPMKAFNKVVHSSKKKGKKAMQHVEKIVSTSITEGKAVTERVVTSMTASSQENENKMSHVRGVGGESDPFARERKQSEQMLLVRLQELEKQNAKLSEKNGKLDKKCKTLQREKDKLAVSLREARRQNRQADWTALDEEEFRNSRRLRLRDQQLVRSPLRQHLEDVDETNDIHSTWVKTGKKHFDLHYPSSWKRAPDLDRRDRAREADITAAPPPSPAIPSDGKNASSKRKAPKKSAEKRRLLDNFKALVKENKKLKFDLED